MNHSAGQGAQSARLRILATTDLHMQLVGFDYAADQANQSTGLTRIAHQIAQARSEADRMGANVLLFDNGDGLQGTPLGDVVMSGPRDTHPLMQAFDYLGYDAIGLGNHDFDFGLDRLATVLNDAPCPILSANLSLTTPSDLSVQDHQVFELAPHGIRVGVFSCLPPQTTMWNAHHLRGRVEISDILATVKQQIAVLKDADCDIIIALAHTGLGSDHPDFGVENAARAVDNMPGLDAVIAGHSHGLVPETPGPGAMVLPGAMGSHLGIIDVDLKQNEQGQWSVARSTCESRPVTPDQDPVLVQMFAEDHAETRRQLSQTIGQTDRALHSYFTSFAPDHGLSFLAHAQAAALTPHVTGTELARFPILSAVAPARLGGRGGPSSYTDIAVGPVTRRHLFDLYPFDNTLCAGLLTAAEVEDWLEMSAGFYNQIQPGQTDLLINPDFAAHNFDILFGLSYEIDLSVPSRFDYDGNLNKNPGQRIRNLKWQGKPLQPDQKFVVAMSSYRANGGGNIPALKNLISVQLPDIHLRDLVQTAFTGTATRSPLADAPYPMQLSALPNTTAIALTGPKARGHLQSPEARGTTDLGMDSSGFLRLSVPLGPT